MMIQLSPQVITAIRILVMTIFTLIISLKNVSTTSSHKMIAQKEMATENK